ncbi:MAG TPA: InlB B-repeat-containing protein, partial [Oscillospiraceae bacterium]|nr:InlB B-repeat-containing protein [Oscillospiraceae bacterium]
GIGGTGTQVLSGTIVTALSNHTLYAQWTPHTYTVTYDGNGSDGGTPMSQSSHTYDVPKALSKNTYTKTGFAFTGWATSTNGTVAYQDQQSVSNLTATNGGNVTLYAVWVAQQYEVQYVGNGADGGTMANSFHTVGQSKKLSKNNYTRTGYNFIGWNEAQDGSGTSYTDEQSVIDLSLFGNVTVPLYAQWSIKQYTISWLANGGSGGGANQADHGTMPTPISAGNRTGYTFTGWSPEIVVATGPASYTAQWQANTYYVSFNANGGTGTMTDQTFVYDTAQNLKANAFAKTGYTFTGWAESPTGPIKYTPGQNVNNLASSQGATVTLYAVWTANTYSVSYNANGGTGTTASSSHTYDISSPLTQNGFSKVGHTFIGWSENQGATSPTYTDQQNVINLTPTPGGTVNFYAVWQINQYTVYFDKNAAIGTGATGTVAPITQNYDTNISLPTSGFSAPGRELMGWHTNSNATSPLSSYKVPAGNSTLYAVWTADYSALDAKLAIATDDFLPASTSKDPGYLPGGDEYDMGGFEHGGYYSRDDFESAGISALTSAVAGVQRGLDHSRQGDVNLFTQTIQNALNNLVLRNADYSQLNAKIAQAEDLLESDYYTQQSHDVLAQALEDAYEYDGTGYKKPLQFVIDGAASALQNAIDGLQLRGADYSEVNDVWNNKPDPNNYTAESVANLENFYHNEIIWTLKINQQSTVDGYADTLRDLIAALVPKSADYSQVVAALKAIPDNDGGAQAVNENYLRDIYTGDSVNALMAAVNAVDWNKNMSEQATVNAYATNIQQKTAALVAKPADYSELYAVLNRSTPYPQDHYTTASYTPYQNRITEGWTLYNAGGLTTLDQHIIDTKVSQINGAYNALELKTVSYTVKYQKADNTSLAADKTGSGKVGSSVTEYPVAVEGYTANQTYISKTLKLNESENVFVFTYTVNEYTISFNSNGGSNVGSITEPYGTQVSAPTAPTKTGYTFAGWYKEAGLVTAVSWPYTIGASNVTFYAKWTANTYTVEYDANGGTGTTADSYHTYDVESKLTANGFSKTGHSFAGWGTSAQGPAVYADEADVKNLTAQANGTVTLYAVWTVNEYTISFNSNGGSPVGSISQDYGTAITPPANPTREGYTFKGWNPAIPNTMPAENLELTAQWEINQYTVSFDSKGGSAVANIEDDYGTQIQTPAAPTKEGHSFAGWYADEAYTTAVTWPYTIGASNVTFYAKWTANQYKVSFDSKGGTAVSDIEDDYGTQIQAPTAPT